MLNHRRVSFVHVDNFSMILVCIDEIDQTICTRTLAPFVKLVM